MSHEYCPSCWLCLCEHVQREREAAAETICRLGMENDRLRGLSKPEQRELGRLRQALRELAAELHDLAWHPETKVTGGQARIDALLYAASRINDVAICDFTPRKFS